MPFTPSHAAAAVPIHRLLGRRLRLSALVIGSMSPDFEYIVRLVPSSKYGHTVPGLFAFCLPVGLAVYTVFHTVMKRPLALLLPDRLRAHAAPEIDRPAFASLWAVGVVCIAILLGAVSHVLWDAFTHKGSDVVHASSMLSATLVGRPGGGFKVYNALQHLSGVLGLALLARWVRLWAARAPEGDASEIGAAGSSPLPSGFTADLRRRLALAICLATALGGTILAAATPLSRNPYDALIGFAIQWAVGAMATLAASTFLYSVAVLAWQRRAFARPDSADSRLGENP